MYVNGVVMEATIKVLMMDNSTFYFSEVSQDKMSDLIHHPENIHLSQLQQGFWNVYRLKMPKFYAWKNDINIPQGALIKFVRNAPSLKWFRSDLTQENRNMLRNEQPTIELVN